MDDWLISKKLKGKKEKEKNKDGKRHKEQIGNEAKSWLFFSWTVAKHQLYLWKALSRKFTLDWRYPFTDHRIHIFRQLIMRAMTWDIDMEKQEIWSNWNVQYYFTRTHGGPGKKWSEKIFGINFLFTCIQFLDCNSCTMLFKHSQFRLWIRDWVFHPLVVKNWPKKEEKLDKQVEVIFMDTVQKERLFTLFCMSSVTCIIKTFSSIPSKRKFKGIERLKLNILSKTTGTPGSYD